MVCSRWVKRFWISLACSMMKPPSKVVSRQVGAPFCWVPTWYRQSRPPEPVGIMRRRGSQPIEEVRLVYYRTLDCNQTGPAPFRVAEGSWNSPPVSQTVEEVRHGGVRLE